MQAPREKILNLPPVITLLLATMAAVQFLIAQGPDWLTGFVYDRFAFVPARFAFLFAPHAVLEHLAVADALTSSEQSAMARMLDTGLGVYLSPVTYAFLHGDWTHFGVNALSLTAFGSPVARRLGASIFLTFAGLCAIAGAMTHFALHPFDFNPVVGASAAISGTMAAIARFAFRPDSRIFTQDLSTAPVDSLSKLGRNRQASLFVVLWLGMNFLLGVFPEAIGVSGAIAWEAHMGGFLVGLVTFGWFDRAARRFA